MKGEPPELNDTDSVNYYIDLAKKRYPNGSQTTGEVLRDILWAPDLKIQERVGLALVTGMGIERQRMELELKKAMVKMTLEALMDGIGKGSE
jgi:hypothetical protein